MKKLKPLLAYLLANILELLIIYIGFTSAYFYYTNDVSFLTVISGITTVIIFYPAGRFWYYIFKKLLNIKNEE
jgi:hypothetical protein